MNSSLSLLLREGRFGGLRVASSFAADKPLVLSISLLAPPASLHHNPLLASAKTGVGPAMKTGSTQIQRYLSRPSPRPFH